MSDALTDAIRHGHILITAGSGGVGKTTTAAVLGLEAARAGRRAVVVTIDPARRLADALGLSDGLSNTPREIAGDWDGELWAMMLDPKSTFDGLVATHSETPEQAARIHGNRFYKNLSGALSGTQEYMAAEKLYELHNNTDYDVVIVDTPPTRNALDFLDAPARLTRFLDHRLYRILIAPTRGVRRVVSAATTAFLKTIARIVGSDVIDDAVAFFRAFDGMEEGFRDRANQVAKLLVDPATAFVLIASPQRDTVAEASYFADRLAESGIAVTALIVNRMQPEFGTGTPEQAEALVGAHGGSPLGELAQVLVEHRSARELEESHLEALTDQVAPAPVIRVPILPSDVHDLEGLNQIAEHLG